MKKLRPPTKAERQAVGLYAVLARDACDFADMVREADDETLGILHKMLTHPNPKHDADTRELNGFGATLVSGEIARRGKAAQA